ncbi:MAG: DUF4004 family protein [Brevinematales bacterium]|jgi:hypothetical protein
MEENSFITKKELLTLTGISYGQLYRWKRENLIPESWFIKKSSFTGQETFFPREKILARIKGIIELKDKYSLEELADMLSPELTNRSFDRDDLNPLGMFDSEILDIFEKVPGGKNHFKFIELIFIDIAGKLIKEPGINTDNIEELARSMHSWMDVLKNTSFRLMVCEKNTVRFFLLSKQDSRIYNDNGTREISSYDLDEISKELNLLITGK